MRTTVTIPDPFYERIKNKLEAKGFTTFNDYLLSLLRNDLMQNDAPPKLISLSVDPKDLISEPYARRMTPIPQAIMDAPKDTTGFLPPQHRCEAPYISCKLGGQEYKATYPTEEGEETKTVWLCPEHAKKARQTSNLFPI